MKNEKSDLLTAGNIAKELESDGKVKKSHPGIRNQADREKGSM